MHDILCDATVIELIERAYAAGCDPAGWQTFLDHIHALLPGAVSLQLTFPGSAPTTWSAGYSEEQIKSYLEHYHALSPYNALFDRLEAGKVYTMTEVGARRWLFRHAFYHEWVKPAGDLTYGASMIVGRDQRRLFRISCDLPGRQGHYEDAGAELLTRLGPHLARAYAVNDRLQAAAATETALSGLLDRIDGGAWLLGTDARVLALNRQAEALARDGHLLRVTVPGRLAFRHPDDEASFRRALAVALGTLAHGAPLAFPVHAASEGAAAVVVLPLRLAAGSAALPWAGPRALLVVEPRRPAALPRDILRALYGLTNAEAGIALQIAGGASIAEAAETQEVTLTTARNQLASAMAKVGVNRQAELVATVGALAPRLRLEGDGR
jgi:DNA-binding CsgD family transcriptional regulator